MRPVYGVAGLRRHQRVAAGMAGARMRSAGGCVAGGPAPVPVIPPANYRALLDRLASLEKGLDQDLGQVRRDIQEVQDSVRGSGKVEWRDIGLKIVETGATVAATVLVTLLVRYWWSATKTGKEDTTAAQEALAGAMPPIM